MIQGPKIALHFPDSRALDHFFSSSEFTALEIRRGIAAAIKGGARVVAQLDAEQPRTVVLRPALHDDDIEIGR